MQEVGGSIPPGSTNQKPPRGFGHRSNKPSRIKWPPRAAFLIGAGFATFLAMNWPAAPPERVNERPRTQVRDPRPGSTAKSDSNRTLRPTRRLLAPPGSHDACGGRDRCPYREEPPQRVRWGGVGGASLGPVSKSLERTLRCPGCLRCPARFFWVSTRSSACSTASPKRRTDIPPTISSALRATTGIRSVCASRSPWPASPSISST